ncbi:helix-turn-helix domain-containing protein [Lachnospiraceae bacterium 47-T17]
MENEIMTLKEVAAYLHIGMTSARKFVRRPDVNFAFQIGAKWLVQREGLERWIDNSSRKGSPEVVIRKRRGR